jgi:uncharacterized protein with HEPN domain
MLKREDRLLLNDMIEHAENVFQFVHNSSYEEFINDKMKVLAVVRCFEIIGEAAAMVSEETKLNNPLVEWRELKDFRNRLIHHYFGIDYETVWLIIKTDLPHNYEFLKRVKV